MKKKNESLVRRSPDSSGRRRIKISLMMGFVVAGTVIAVVFGLQEEVLPVGSTLPKLKYFSPHNTEYISVKEKPVMIMYFKPECSFCEYELEVIEKRIDELSSADIYLITTEKNLFKESIYKKRENLFSARNVKFGWVVEEEYREKFGIMATPAFYFFNQENKLVDKIIGETKFDRILGSIKKAGGAQYRQSGLR